MANSCCDSSAAQGYQKNSFSIQRSNGEVFIQTDVCPQAGDVILDLGCGTGELSAYLAELVGLQGKIVGVDPDKERILLAQQSYSEIQNLSFVEGSGSNFPGIGTETYDIIFCNVVLHWIANKQQTFKNMFKSLKEGGKIAVQYWDYLPPFMANAFKVLNPENAERICKEMLQFEPKVKIEQYCLSAAFEIVKSYELQVPQNGFENIESLLKWLWSTTHGVFDPSLATEERLQRYLVPYSNTNGKACLDFGAVKEESTACRLVAVKQARKIDGM